MLKYCQKCHSENDGKATKCVVCGEELSKDNGAEKILDETTTKSTTNIQEIFGIIITVLGFGFLVASIINQAISNGLNILASIILIGIGVSIYGIGKIVVLLQKIEENTQPKKEK